MSTTFNAYQPHRAWHAVVVATAVAAVLAIVIAVMAYAATETGGTDRPTPVNTVPLAGPTPTPGNGLPCPIHQRC